MCFNLIGELESNNRFGVERERENKKEIYVINMIEYDLNTLLDTLC